MYTYIRAEVCLLWQAKRGFGASSLLPLFLKSIKLVFLSSAHLVFKWFSKKSQETVSMKKIPNVPLSFNKSIHLVLQVLHHLW